MSALQLLFFHFCLINLSYGSIPLVVNTWKFQDAARNAWKELAKSAINEDNILDVLVAGCNTCQIQQCDFTVGFGGSPDESGETTLDALIFDGNTMDMGAVGGLRNVKNAIEVARLVLERTEHSFLSGELASNFAKSLGLPIESLQTNYSQNVWKTWQGNNCQPNFWKNVSPDPKRHCGPYSKKSVVDDNEIRKGSNFDSGNHDTIGMVAIHWNGHIVAGTSTNGANHKIPGRVGDSPIPGAGAYADSEVGAAAATGDGDVMMRFLPSFVAVEQLRNGASPAKAALIALSRIIEKYHNFFGAVIVVNKKGEVGAACSGMDVFPFTIANQDYPDSIVKYVNCSNKMLN